MDMRFWTCLKTALIIGCAAVASCSGQGMMEPEMMASLVEERSEAMEEKLAELIPEDAETHLVAGYVVDTPEGLPQISTDDGVIIPIANPDLLLRLPKDIPSNFSLMREGDSIRVDDVDLNIMTHWRESSDRLPISRFASLHRSFGALENTVAQLMQSGAMSVDDEQLQRDIEAASDAAVEAYQATTSAEESLRTEICQRFGELRDLRLKARFGREDNYWPEVYQRIYENSRTAVAIARNGQHQPFGSGVVIGKSLVLTCRHVVRQYPADQLEVWLDYETTSSGAQSKQVLPVNRVLFEGQASSPGTKPLDFALIELGDASTQPPRTTLSSAEPSRDDAIYVIGHPERQPRMVHDNAFVLFPFRVNEDGLTELKMIVCAETSKSPNAEAELKSFLDSYVRVGMGNEFLLYSQRWENSPVIAADCDTSHGNSGSGAWNRNTGRLVGLLFAGEYDLGESYTAGWRRHEAILPISVVIKQLDNGLPHWRSTYEVVIQ